MFEGLFVIMATNLPSCFLIQFLEQLYFTLLKYVTSQRSYGFLITKELILGFQILDLKVHFSASLRKLYLWTIFRQFPHFLPSPCFGAKFQILLCLLSSHYQSHISQNFVSKTYPCPKLSRENHRGGGG